MVNCNYLNYNEKVVFGTIVANKDNRAKTVLQGITNRVYTTYDQYINNFHSLLTKTRSELRKAEVNERRYLVSCYNIQADTFKQIRGSIFSAQPNVLKVFCPYCLLNKPKTIDHYIPKEEFPEYSVLIKNLIPCCWECNHAKDELWRKSGSRRFIHYHIDRFLNNRFLYAKFIQPRGQVIPVIHFYLAQGPLSNQDFRIVKFHFKHLSLLTEYNSRANTFVSAEIDVIRSSKQLGLTVAQIQSNLLTRFTSLSTSHGINYWHAVLYDALANNTRLLNSL